MFLDHFNRKLRRKLFWHEVRQFSLSWGPVLMLFVAVLLFDATATMVKGENTMPWWLMFFRGYFYAAGGGYGGGGGAGF